ncbi:MULTISPECIES: DUF1778 domain-containing protein [Aeromonas]|uniref:type II toxin-antitoxin system TacA family antitoxin n=1 Tax=Aeromonas TaxID=642 RepID=UPI000F7950B4|nr:MULTISPECIES: DUF1778 domain-containing protein [Aeromonas]RSM21719.1 hypothetical protein C5B76_19925 [Aeromonas salmonicida]TNI93647.1 hypothetical protein CF120_04005 [Aeromonas allosaccharophila]
MKKNQMNTEKEVKSSLDRVDLRLDTQTKNMFERAAIASDMTLTAFMKAAAKRMADEVLERSKTIQLAAAEHDKFMNLLAAPVEFNSRMKAAISSIQNGVFEIERKGTTAN